MLKRRALRRESSRREAYGRSPIVLVCAAAIILATALLAGFSMLTARDQVADSRAAARSAGLAALYGDARLLVRQRELLEIDYRLDPQAESLTERRAAAGNLRADFARIAVANSSPATRMTLGALALADRRYTKVSDELFRAIGRGDSALADRLDRRDVDPAYRTLDRLIAHASDAASAQSIRQANHLRDLGEESQWQIALAFAASIVVIALFVAILVGLRRRLAAALRDKIEKLSDVAFRDALTGLRNRRSFRDDLERSVAQLDRGGVQFSLCMLDLDGLKTVNDTLGHPSGDTHIRAFANALRQTVRASDSAYRIGGDEFAIVLHGERAPGALELIGRLNDTLARIDGAVRVSAGAGIVEAQHARSTEELVCQADIALLAAKRTNQRAVVYDPETSDLTLDARKTHADTATLSNALALAVDAKDPYTRSHSQVVSRLCGLVAEALGLDDEHVAQMRLAGLLHDVGKIGVPDALLAKPGALTDSEQAVDAPPRSGRRRDRRGRRPRRGVRLGSTPPRTLRRHGLSRRAARRRDPARIAHHPRL